MSKIKLVFFDMEGVIFETGIIRDEGNTSASVWAVIPKVLGPDAVKAEQKGVDMWNAGEFKSYMDWCDYASNFYKKYGLTMKKFYGVIDKVKFIKGVEKTFKEIHKRGYRTAIISGGIKNLANRAIRKLGVDHALVAVEFFFDEKTGKMTNWNILPVDYEGKVDFMKLMMRELKLTPKECAFIGDGINDVPIAKQVGLSIAFNGRKELQEVCTHSINQKEKDLSAILKYFP